MKIPQCWKHKPVIVVNNYEHVDGKVANESDAKGLSIGLAQWNDRGSVEASAKVWRHTGENGQDRVKSFPCTGCSIWHCSFAGQVSISRMLIGFPSTMTQQTPRSTVLVCKVMP